MLERVRELVSKGDYRASTHAFDEAQADDIDLEEVAKGIGGAHTVEEYPNYPKGPCVLVLQQDERGKPILM